MAEPIYLDHNASTPPAAEVVEAMVAVLRDGWGNPSSSHVVGRRARATVEVARGQVAALLGCDADEIVFTGGGTEADNAAILGVTAAVAPQGGHVVTSAIEHPAIERCCADLERRGYSVTRVGVDADGRVHADDVAAALRPDTALVSIMHANNESGVVQPIGAISAITRARGVVLHTDAAQSVGKIPTSVTELGVDLLTVAGHKLNGPQGVGALYLRGGTPFRPWLLGAGHEGGRRAGTENVAGIAGLGAACALARAELGERAARMRALRDRLLAGLRAGLGPLIVHGERAERLPNTLYVALPGVRSAELAARVPTLAFGAGAACHAGKTEVSATLAAMGVAPEVAACTVRLSLGRSTREGDVDLAVERLVAAARGLREDPAP